MYKFEVYLNQSRALTLESRYRENDYVFERTIQPTWNDLELAGEKTNGRMFFRETLRGSFRLTGADYDWAYGIFNSAINVNKFRYLKISEQTGGVWTEIWRGFFTIADGVFDLSKCFVEYSGLITFDRYSTIIESINAEKNMIDVPVTAPVNYKTNQYPYDEIRTFDSDTITSNFCSIAYGGVSVLTTGIKYILYRKRVLVSTARIMVSPSGICSYYAELTYEYTYRRDWQYAAIQPSPEWEEDTDADPDINGNKRWVRHYRGDSTPSYGLTTTYTSPQLYPSSQEVQEAGCSVCNLPNYDYLSRADADSEVQNDRARLFWSVIDHIIDGLITYTNPDNILDTRLRSQFFLDDTNPITEAANTLQYLVIWQLSDMKDTSDPATIAQYSFSTIEDLVKMWDVFWYIDDEGRLWFEHRKFFDQGLSYSGNSVGLDITTSEFMKGKIVVTYIDDLPQEERMKFQNAIARDFVGVPIKYRGNVVRRDEGTSVVEMNFSNVSTDLNQVTSNQDEIGNDGFFIAVTETNGSELDVIVTPGILSNRDLYNGLMAVSYLHDYYWKWGRSLSSGEMNEETTDFTQKAVISHEDIVLTNCGSFDPYKLVRTEYGEGRVETYLKTLKDKKLTMTLLYNA